MMLVLMKFKCQMQCLILGYYSFYLKQDNFTTTNVLFRGGFVVRLWREAFEDGYFSEAGKQHVRKWFLEVVGLSLLTISKNWFVEEPLNLAKKNLFKIHVCFLSFWTQYICLSSCSLLDISHTHWLICWNKGDAILLIQLHELYLMYLVLPKT